MPDMMSRVKRFFGFGSDYEYDDYDESYEEEVVVDTPAEPQPQPVKSVRTRRSSNNVVNLHTDGNMVITVHEPLSYDESPLIVDDLKSNKAVVLNFEQLDLEVKREIFDFVNGALYAIEGKIQKVNKDIFILAPHSVEIDGLKEELQNAGIFRW